MRTASSYKLYYIIIIENSNMNVSVFASADPNSDSNVPYTARPPRLNTGAVFVRFGKIRISSAFFRKRR